MKISKPTKKNAVILLTLAMSLTLIIGGIVWHQQAIRHRDTSYHIKQTLSAEILPFKDTLRQLGFNVDVIKGSCVSPDPRNPNNAGSPALDCTASISSYTVVGDNQTTLDELNIQATALSKLFDEHGWKQRPDLRTTDWFKSLSKGVDYQPDQLNYKRISATTTCTIDFFTAFSKPSPVAMNLQASCGSPGINLDDRFTE